MENTNVNNTKPKDNDKVEIDLGQVFGMLARRWVLIVAVGVITAVLTFACLHFIVTPKYTSTARIMVINRQNNEAVTATDLTSSATLSNDYVEIVTSRSVMEQVIADLELNYTVEELTDKVKASIVTNTRMINISVTDPDPILAKEITDSISAVSSKKICQVMNIENMVSLVDEGSLPTDPSSPATMKDTVIAALIAVIITCVVIVIIGINDDRIKTKEDVEKNLGVSVLGVIPLFDRELADGTHTGNVRQRVTAADKTGGDR